MLTITPGGGSVLPTMHSTEAQHAAMLSVVSGPDSSLFFTDESLLEQKEKEAQQQQQQQQEQEESKQQDDEVTREDMVDAMNGQGDHTNETELIEEKEPEHMHVQSAVGEGGEIVMGGMEGGGGGF